MTTQTLEPVAKNSRRRERIWTEQEYLDLPGGKLVEFDNGHVEVLPMPSEFHQDVAGNIFTALRAFVRAKNLGKVLCAPMPVKVDLLKYREPDVLFKRKQKLAADPKTTKFWDGADLVVEVVSDGTENRRRNLIVKRAAYAAAKISECWLVDLEDSKVTVLKLRAGKYVVHGTIRGTDHVQSALFPELELSVADIFAA
ncbi:MAG: Uma2 family endonuclease [Planctomycetaceae bacterium]